MKSREVVLGAGLALSISACGSENTPQPDPLFTEALPQAVVRHQDDVFKVGSGRHDGTAFAFTLGNKRITATARHTVDECGDTTIFSTEGQKPATPKLSSGAKDLAVLAIERAASDKAPRLAAKKPVAKQESFFITYQEDNGVPRGPEQAAPFDKPATFSGIVAKVTSSEVTYAMPTKLGSYQEFAGASGAPVFSASGDVEAVISKVRMAPRGADAINDEFNSSLPDGHYNIITATPVSQDVFEAKGFLADLKSC